MARKEKDLSEYLRNVPIIFIRHNNYQGEDVRSKVLNGGRYDKLDSKIILFMIDWFVHSH